MTLEKLKKIIPNSKDWISSEEITFGWSGEQKYKIQTNNGETLLLRILSKEQFENQKKGIEFLGKCGEKSSHVPQILEIGTTLDNSYCFLLLSYIIGDNGMSEIEKYSKDEQYVLGLKMGEIIKSLHSLSSPKRNTEYSKIFKEKIIKYLHFFAQNKGDFPFLHNTEKNLLKLQKIIKKRPIIMIHNDFHLGNMIINNNDIFLIDFNRATFGDNIKEFDCIAWSATHSENFVAGLLDAYLESENKQEFFEILRCYISLWELQMLSFIETEDDDEKKTVIDLIKYTESWFDKNEYIPNWYLKYSKK